MTSFDRDEIAPGIFWIGDPAPKQNLACNPYVLVDGDEAVMIEPGSVLDFELVRERLEAVVPLERVSTIILGHQDPDLASSVPLFEKAGFSGVIACHWRASVIIRYYGIQSPYYLVDRQDYRLQLKSGRVLEFIPTPYLHFPGAVATYDSQTGTLFSSDLFGAFDEHWTLYANKNRYMEGMKAFHEHYMPSAEILSGAMDRLSRYDIKLIAPQHGSIIREDIPDYLNVLRNLRCGSLGAHVAAKDLAEAGGYSGLVSQVLRRWADIYSLTEVQHLCDAAGILINPLSLSIDSFEGSGEELWERIFDQALTHKDPAWLSVVEGLVNHLQAEYGVDMPGAFQNRLSWLERERETLREQNQAIRESQMELDRRMQSIQQQLIRDPVTGLYNETFFERYARSELARNEVPDPRLGFLFVSIDHLAEINNRYGDAVGDEALKAVSVALLSMISPGAVCFRLQAAVIGVFIRNMDRGELAEHAEHLRASVAESSLFVEKLTVSVAAVSVSEFLDEGIEELEGPETALIPELVSADDAPRSLRDREVLFETIRNELRIRLQAARSGGMNRVCAETPRVNEDPSHPLVLVADTDALMLDVLTRSLATAGYRVLRYRDGAALWQGIQETGPSLVISELFLPQMDAFAVRELMRESSETRGIPFLLVSHRKDEAGIARAVELDIEHYLKKPFFLNEVLGIVSLRLRRKR